MAKRKTLFDDRPVEISELTYVIKQDLASLNHQIAGLQALTLSQHPKSSRSKADQEGEHNDNVRNLETGELRGTLLTIVGGCYASREAGRCWSQLQGSARGSDKEHPSIAIENGEFRFLSIIQITVRSRHTAVRFTFIQHVRKTHTSTGIPG